MNAKRTSVEAATEEERERWEELYRTEEFEPSTRPRHCCGRASIDCPRVAHSISSPAMGETRCFPPSTTTWWTRPTSPSGHYGNVRLVRDRLTIEIE